MASRVTLLFARTNWAVRQDQLVQQFGDGGDLVRLAIYAALSQHEALGARPGADDMQRRLLPPAVKRAPDRLAVDDHHLALKAGHERAGPGREAGLEGPRVDQHEYAPEGVVRGNAVRQLQEGPQPVQFAAAVQGDVVPTLSTGDHRAHRNHQNVGQAMLDFAAAARVCYHTKMLYQGLDRHNPLLLLIPGAGHPLSAQISRQKFHASPLPTPPSSRRQPADP